MKSFRFIHAADLHLDSPFRGLTRVPEAIRKVIRGSTFEALERLVDAALRERVQFVVIAGDIYDTEDRSVRAQLRFHRAMERLAEAGIQVFIAHGNHDSLSGKHLPWQPPQGIRVFAADEPQTFAVRDQHGELLAYVHGISYATAVVTDNLAARFRVRDREVFNIGVLHMNIDGSTEHANYAPASRSQLAAAGMDYWALGHIHVRGVLHEAPHIVYSGNTQGRSVRETGAKGVYIVDVDETRSVKLSFEPTDAVRWLQTDVSIEGAGSELDVKMLIERELSALREKTDGRPAVVRLVISGRSGLHHELQRTTFLEEFIAEWHETESTLAEQDEDYPFIWIESCKLQTRGLIDLELLRKQDSFIGDLLRIASELRADEAVLSEFAEQLMSDLQRSRAGKYIRMLEPIYLRAEGGDTSSIRMEEPADDGSGDNAGATSGQALRARDRADYQQELAELLKRAENWLIDRLVEGGEGL